MMRLNARIGCARGKRTWRAPGPRRWGEDGKLIEVEVDDDDDNAEDDDDDDNGKGKAKVARQSS